MTQPKPESDQEILARLREPIGDLINEYCGDRTEIQRLRLRQLAWQAVDVLVRTGNLAYLREEKDIKRIIRDIKEIGASEEFIEDSLALALSIYREMQTDYPDLLRKYQGSQ